MDINKYWTERATVRSFNDFTVDDELLNSLLLKASHAPTTGNMQLYSVVVTREEEKKKELLPAHFNQPAAAGATVLLTFCADYNRYALWCRQRNADPGCENLQSFIAALLDVALLAQQFNTVAELEGLGCCYLGTTTYNAPQIAKVLELPKLVVPVITLAVGYPAVPVSPSDRLSPEAFIHNETYRNYSSADIDRIYSFREGLEENKRFVEENKKDNLAQVFAEVRYTKANNEFFSKVYRDFVEEAGFVD